MIGLPQRAIILPRCRRGEFELLDFLIDDAMMIPAESQLLRLIWVEPRLVSLPLFR